MPRNGAVWYDRAGHVLNAHGGCDLLHGGRYYLFGEHKVYGTTGNFAHVGVHAYSSDDLSEWTDGGLALAVGGKGGLPDGCVIERPKVIFCATTGKFVMYFHWERDAHYNEAMVGIAQADSPAGPYVLMRTVRPTPSTYPINARDEDRGAAALVKSESEWKVPCNRSPEGERALIYPAHVAQGQESRDMTLFVDRNKTAYLIHSSERNSTLHVVELSDDYVGFTGRWWRIAEKDWTEAPAVCEKDGWYYLIGSDCTGWAPNVARAYRARAIIGPWERLGNPCRGINPANGRGPELTWGGQSNFILETPDGRHLAMFDIWNPQNQLDSRLVWLPVRFESGEPVIEWQDRYK